MMGDAMLRSDTRVAMQAVVIDPFAVLTKSGTIDQNAEGMNETAGHTTSLLAGSWSRLPSNVNRDTPDAGDGIHPDKIDCDRAAIGAGLRSR
jgi:hypothetical protein